MTNQTPQTQRVNRTLQARDDAHTAQDALDAIKAELIAADGLPSIAQLEAFASAAQNLYANTLHSIAYNQQEAGL